jgi:hypothetical protein
MEMDRRRVRTLSTIDSYIAERATNDNCMRDWHGKSKDAREYENNIGTEEAGVQDGETTQHAHYVE